MPDPVLTAKDVFLGSLRCDPSGQAAYVAEHCGDDRLLRDRVEQLLAAHHSQRSLLDHPLIEPHEETAPRILEGPGTVIGPYKLLELIGEGGFGLVFMAEQSRPVRRRVALKVVKPGMDTRQIVARFEGERQALALMDHPHIARIFDGGMTDSGRPYFVMELVRGVPITAYCEQCELDVRRRLTLFADVCRAIEHAHQRGIIHRDIKPQNILISIHDDAPFVKVIDFGIAKAIGQDLTEKTLFTRFAHMIGTPLYMSPEQSANALDIDTRSDIYSLGVVLYELLTGTPPFDRERVKQASLDEVLHMIREEEPPLPSRRATTRRQARTISTPPSSTDLGRSSPPIFRDELDWIVMKALEKNRQQRYPTADALLADVQRYLTDEPLEARPPSKPYLLRKFVKRHKVAATIGSVLAISLTTIVAVLGVSASRLQLSAHRLQVELERTERAERAERIAKQEAQSQLWGSFLNEAHAKHRSRQSGQRLGALRAIENALRIPTPAGRSRAELRTEATAAICLPDLEIALIWPHASRKQLFALDDQMGLFGVDDALANQFVVRETSVRKDRMRLELVDWKFDYQGPIFSPDSQLLVYAKNVAGETRLHLWRVGNEQPLVDLGRDAVNVCFQPDGQRCAVSHAQGLIRILECRSFDELHRYETGLIAPALAWNPRFPQLAAADRNRWRVLDIETGRTLREVEAAEGLMGWPAWHPSGAKLAIAFGNGQVGNGRIGIWDSTTGQPTVPPLSGHRNGGIIVRFSPSGNRLVSTDWNHLVRLWDSNTGQQLLTVPANGVKLQFSQDGAHFGADCAPSEMRFFRYQSGDELQTIWEYPGRDSQFTRNHASPCLNRTGRFLAMKSAEGVCLIDLHRNEVVCRLPISGNGPLRFQQTPAGESLWTYGQLGLLNWPLRIDQESAAVTVGPPERTTYITVEGTWDSDDKGEIVVVPTDRGGLVWNGKTKERFVLPHPPDVRTCAVTPDGRLAFTGSHSHLVVSVKVWDLETRSKIADLDFSASSGVFLSPDGKWLVTNGGGTRLWRVGEWTDSRLLGHIGRQPCFSADSRLLALSDELSVVRLIDPETGREVAVLTGPESTRLVPIAFTPDGGRLITVGSETGALHIFDLRAIRRQLAALNLDWEYPPLPPESQEVGTEVRPLQVTLDPGNLSNLRESTDFTRQGRSQYREGKHSEAVASWRRAVELDPRNSLAHNQIAWTLAAGPEELRDVAGALAAAIAATNLEPRFPTYLNTLGVAQFRAGHWDDSIATLNRVASERGFADGYDAFFIAMAHWKRGAPDDAREWLAKAVAWMEQNASGDSELIRFRREAEQLIPRDNP